MGRNSNKPASNTRNSNNKPRVEERPTQPQKTVYDQLKFDAANIFFNNIIGSKIMLRKDNTFLNDQTLPGVLTFEVIPNYTSKSDMINVAATSIYTYVRHANAGRSNYESSDLMMYLLQFGEIFAALSHLMRTYGIANYFTTRNIYSGHVPSALGYSATDIRKNLANYRYRINVIISKLKAFAIPMSFSYFEEIIEEYSHVYLDEADPKAQMYAFVPKYLGRFNPTFENGGGLEFGSENELYTNDFGAALDQLDELLDFLRSNEDMNIISGDILKAYGDNLFKLSPIDLDFKVEPIFDPLKLMQIQNAHIVPISNRPNLIQKRNRIQDAMPLATDGESGDWLLTSGKRFLNSVIDDVDANYVYAISKYQVNTDDDVTLESAGLFIITSMTIHSIKYDVTTGREPFIESRTFKQVNELNGTYETAEFITNISKFRFYPYIYFFADKAGVETMFNLPLGDMHNVVIIDTDDTSRMNDSRFVLAFRTPQMG